jgi:hypothetical protein
MRMRHLSLLLTLALLPATAVSGDKKQHDGFQPMFNGKDLTGWINVNCAPETFFVKDDMIITTGKPIGYLRTERQYENFIAEFDWMHLPPRPGAVGNSGFFVWADPIPAVGTGYTRGIEVQVLVNLEWTDKKSGKSTATSQGDLFSIWGATCFPDRPHPLGWERCIPLESHCKGENEWNHYRVHANDGVIKLSVNGKEVSGVSKCSPRKGYLALESEGSECRFKNLKIKELPSTNPTAKEICDVAKGFQSIFTGLDLRGWKSNDEQKAHWKPGNSWGLNYDGQGKGTDANLWTAKEYRNFEMVVDWRLPRKPIITKRPVLLPSGEIAKDGTKIRTAEVLDAGDSGILLRGTDKGQVAITCWPSGSGELRGYRADEGQLANIRAACVPKEKADKEPGKWNRFRIRVKGDRVTVFLNDKLVIDNAHLPGLAERGPIGLQSLDAPVEFGNLFVRELGNDE